LSPYAEALALLRWRGRPLGQVRLEVAGDCMPALEVWQAASAALGPALPAAALEAWWPRSGSPEPGPLPSATVVICTRHRPDDLRQCLQALLAADLTNVEILVVDNAPADHRTQQVVSEFGVRYAVEPRRGLNWARTRGAELATGDIVIYTDDDVLVAPDWANAIRQPFSDPNVAAVTGLVLAHELETAAQEFFERQTSFGRGYGRRTFMLSNLSPLAAANVGAGASMAFRRAVLTRVRPFALELDAGTAARSGGDTYAFYRLLSLGHQFVYAPEAVVWHRHRRTEAELRATLYGYTLGTLVCWLRCLLQHGELEVLLALAWWLRHHHWQNLADSLRRFPNGYPLRLALAEWGGCLAAPGAYLATRWQERRGLPAGRRPR
jgi:glycosyltransferase involved in cell wall biosynthesis